MLIFIWRVFLFNELFGGHILFGRRPQHSRASHLVTTLMNQSFCVLCNAIYWYALSILIFLIDVFICYNCLTCWLLLMSFFFCLVRYPENTIRLENPSNYCFSSGFLSLIMLFLGEVLGMSIAGLVYWGTVSLFSVVFAAWSFHRVV